MDIQKEKDAFLNVFQFFKSFKGIGFSEETEQFFLKKNKPNDAECLDVSNLNQMWRAWWARAKSQVVPEGFVVVPRELSADEARKHAEAMFNKVEHMARYEQRDLNESEFESFKNRWIDARTLTIQFDWKAMIEAQEQSHERQNP